MTQAASTGERPCPKCIARLGDKAPAVMAEFCMTEEDLMQQTMCAWKRRDRPASDAELDLAHLRSVGAGVVCVLV